MSQVINLDISITPFYCFDYTAAIYERAHWGTQTLQPRFAHCVMSISRFRIGVVVCP